MRYEPDLDDVRGHIQRAVITQVGSVRFGEVESTHRTVRTIELDGDGRFARQDWSYASGATSRTRYEHDALGRLTQTVEVGAHPGGPSWTRRRFYTYDSQGRLVQEQLTADGAVIGRRVWVYTADGRRIQEERFDREHGRSCCAPTIGIDRPQMSFVCQGARAARVVHDPSGAPIDVTFMNRLGLSVGKVVFQSDAAGRITAIQSYGDIGTFDTVSVPAWLRPLAPAALFLTRRVLNAHARWSLVQRSDWRTLARTLPWGPLRFELRTCYDAFGRRVEERNIAEGADETIKTWTYDADGHVIEQRHVDDRGTLIELRAFTYDVDERGNWIHRRMTSPSVQPSAEDVTETTTRMFTYAD